MLYSFNFSSCLGGKNKHKNIQRNFPFPRLIFVAFCLVYFRCEKVGVFWLFPVVNMSEHRSSGEKPVNTGHKCK